MKNLELIHLTNMKANNLVPKLRFKGFDDNWLNKLIEDLFVFKNGLNKEKEYFGSGTPIINFTDVYHLSGIKINDIKGLVNLNNSEKERFSAKKGDVFFTRTSESIIDIGMSAVLLDDIEDCVFSGFVLRARPLNNDLNLNFKKYCFSVHSVRKEIVRKSSITTRALTSGTLLNKVTVSFPSTQEQNKIASFLTSVDKKINLLTKKKALLETYKKGVMQKIFSQEIRFKDEFGNSYAVWEKKKLGELTFKVGKKNKENIQLPIYSINNQEGFRPQSEQFEGLDSNERGYNISLYKIVDSKTFAYNPARINVGSIGYSNDLNQIIISSLYVCFKTTKQLQDKYLLAYLKSHRFNKDILRYEEGGVRQYLFYENFSLIPISLPSIKEQNKIAEFLSSIDKKIELVDFQIERNKEFKKGLLQQMFV